MQPGFRGDLDLSNIVPAERYTLSGRGKGGMLGLAAGAADIVSPTIGGGTLLVFTPRAGPMAASCGSAGR